MCAMCVGKEFLRVGFFNKIISWVALEAVSVVVRKGVTEVVVKVEFVQF